jgi:hypothetical protein
MDAEVEAPAPLRYTRLLARTAPSLDHEAATEPATAPEFGKSTATEEEHISDLVVDPNPVYSEAEAVPAEHGHLQELLKQHWADVCLAVSAAILATSLFWAFWPHAAAVGKNGGQPALTPFEQILVAVGLAEAPAPIATYTGSPNTQVWVDVHTALYYCGGSEEYGKTGQGRFLTQHEAQYQQFQPAHNRPCD